jgi:CBS domain-containing protein
MLISDLLRTKGADVATIGPDATVHEAILLLVERRIGAVIVTAGDEVLGILSERDVLRLAARGPERLAAALVRDIMTRSLVVTLPSDDMPYVMAIMTNNRVRHLPVMDQGRLVGIVSIGDVVNASLSQVEAENRWLKDYIAGMA